MPAGEWSEGSEDVDRGKFGNRKTSCLTEDREK